MAFVPYLEFKEYTPYGIPDAVPAQVAAASRKVNAYIGRPEGLLWSPDANGTPAFMTHLTPTRSFKAAVAAGTGVTVAVPNASFGLQTVGEIVVLDRCDSDHVEACVVTAASGNTITLASVQFAHVAATIDFGLSILEESTLRPGQPAVYAARTPLAQLLAIFTRPKEITLPRQLSGDTGLRYFDPTLGVSTLASWTQIDLTQCDINFTTGAVRLPPGAMSASGLHVRLHYLAGWAKENLPFAVKQAVANIAQAAIDTGLPGNVKLMKSGDATIERFADGVLDADTRSLLDPYRVLRLA